MRQTEIEGIQLEHKPFTVACSPPALGVWAKAGGAPAFEPTTISRQTVLTSTAPKSKQAPIKTSASF
jgi:hypothetical protein